MRTGTRFLGFLCIAAVLSLASCSDGSTGTPARDITAGDATDDAVADTPVADEAAAEVDSGRGDESGSDAAGDPAADGNAAEVDAATDVVVPDAPIGDDAVAADLPTAVDAAETVANDGPGTDEGGGGPTLEFRIVGDPASEVQFADSWSSQTPSAFYVGIQKVELLESPDDPAPVIVFDAGDDACTEVDMQGSTSLAKVDLFAVTSGTYTYARVLLATARFTVQTRVHPPFPVPALSGPLAVVAALSDTKIDSTQRAQDWVQYSFNAGGFPFTKTGTLPPFPDSATGDVIREGGRTWLQMELSQHLAITPSISTSYVATVTLKTKNSFRWEDQSTSGYAAGVFDSDSSGTSEPVKSVGPGEYSIVIAGE